ncbi:hypothetical protein IV203_029573 [Nitzschia inconspicua]|uniref:Uncharacterized protein n=1 Tax=Nitzschia inconspicua TaxID=303405 RepID=A0A9K3LS10_9STRA|nr:hypothetical protein IV203_029573 [Nitzschia inconspicua]
MVWKKTKLYNKGSRKLKSVPEEAQPKLKSCLKKSSEPKSSSDQESSHAESCRTSGDGSSNKEHGSDRSVATRSLPSSNCSRSIESRGSGESSTVPRKSACNDQMSVTDESSAEHGQSSYNSERSTQSALSSSVRKRVRFNAIQIRDYERVVGDNPSCTSGPPLSIGWKYGKTAMIDVNSYEMARPFRKCSRRLILSREQREALLLNWGASFHDIVESVRGNIKVKNQRRQTVTNLGRTEKIEEAFESATRKLKRALLLRRSTGNKVKRLQEQANLAQRALASLKIAEDRALNEIRHGRIPTREEPEKDDLGNYNLDVSVSSFARSAPADSKVRLSSHMISPRLVASEDEDYFSAFDGFTLGGNSTTPSQLEMERFYRELELEMFGDEELPSMVGQTLELPSGTNEATQDYNESFESNINLDDSLNSGFPSPANLVSFMKEGRISNFSVTSQWSRAETKEDVYCDDLDAALELEQNRSMISRSLLEDDESEGTKLDAVFEQGDRDSLYPHYLLESMHPPHGDYITSRYPSATSRFIGSMDSADLEKGRTTASLVAMEYQSSKPHYHLDQQSLLPLPNHLTPLHAGMSMFQDCALLAVSSEYIPSYSFRKQTSSTVDSNAGPRIQHLPPPNHFSPSHWMEDRDSIPLNFYQGYQTVTICEDSDPVDDSNEASLNYYKSGSRYVASQKFPPSCY